MPTVREATFNVLRAHGLTTLFANPGSTEISLLSGLPEDLRFVLGLHEGAVISMAAGYAIGRGAPALALLHTTAGLGNAVNAIATARTNRAPVVILVGQQDRRHLALEPFLAGHLQGLAGEYPVWVNQPVRAQDLPGAVGRAAHEAVTGRGPAIVIVPMDDWSAEAETEREDAAAAAVRRATAVSDADVEPIAALLSEAASPALVVGAGADSAGAWSALVALAERLGCPVWQEAFGGRAGFPQDHPRFAGHLPADRKRTRERLGGHDAVLVVGTGVLRQYPYQPGRFTAPGTRLAVITDDPAEAHRSPVEYALLADPAAACARLAELVSDRSPAKASASRGAAPAPVARAPAARGAAPAPPAEGEPLRATHVLAALAERLPADAVVVEETPSSRPDLHALVPARAPLGFLSAAMGGLGFAIPAAAGVRMARPERPVVAVVGDGSAVFGIQALWSAARYRCGALFIVLANGRYAVMDRLAEMHGGGGGPWPGFEEVDVSGLARAFGCPARRVATYAETIAALDEVVPSLAGREEPLVLEVAVEPDRTFSP
ncbi:MAG TPA: thiamine pyrophosphate-dependent enzyme [Solirubrobacteraceae bacterium]